jgi:hypothetical protein
MRQKRCDLHAGYVRQEYRHTLTIFNKDTVVTVMYRNVVFVSILSGLFVKRFLYHFKLNKFRKL